MTSPLLVFHQGDPALDVPAWNAYATRFLRARIALVRVVGPAEICVTVTPEHGPAGDRSVAVRGVTAEDRALAEAAEQRQGGGLGLVARRCATVWVVERPSATDAATLTLAAVLAGVGLGPALDLDVPALFGVKTARGRLPAGPAT